MLHVQGSIFLKRMHLVVDKKKKLPLMTFSNIFFKLGMGLNHFKIRFKIFKTTLIPETGTVINRFKTLNLEQFETVPVS